ncbi:hypothetical protein ACRAVF_27050 [Bradyrhizobium oligotrophicum S58]
MSPAIRDGLISIALAWLLIGTFIRAVILPIAPNVPRARSLFHFLAEFVVSTLIWPRYVVAFVRGFFRHPIGRR